MKQARLGLLIAVALALLAAPPTVEAQPGKVYRIGYRGRDSTSKRGARHQGAHVRLEHRVRSRWAFSWSDGGDDASRPCRARRSRSRAVGALSAGPRRTGPRRRPRGDLNRRPEPARLRRAGSHLRERDAGLLGLRCDTPGGRGEGPRGTHDDPRARADVRDRPSPQGRPLTPEDALAVPPRLSPSQHRCENWSRT